MSSEESLDPQLIEQTRQQIRSLVGEIAQLTKEDVAPEEFYGEFLPRVVSALAAIGGAVWTTNEDGRLALQHQVNLHQTRLRESEQDQARHGRLLYKCLSGGEGMLVPPHSGGGEDDEEQAGNPTDFLVVLGPLKTDLEVVGVLEVFQRSEAGPSTQKGYLRFVMQMCELAGDFLKSHQLRHFSDRQVLWTQLEDFTHVVHNTLDPRGTAYTIANEGRRLIECDRVSVAIRRGNKCKIEAVSGQDLFDKRSNTVRLLGQLATAVVRTGDPVWYAGDTRDMAPQVEDAIQEYVDESHSKNVAVLPLKRPLAEEEDDPTKRDEPEPPIGALIVEQIEDSRLPPSMVQRVEVVCRHSSTALANSLEHQNLFLMPLWRLLGKTRWVLRARTLPKTLAIAGLVLAVLLWLVLWPADFEVSCKGTLEPVERRDVFARTDGHVEDVFVEHRDRVYPEETLSNLEVAIRGLENAGKVVVDQAFFQKLQRALHEKEKEIDDQTAREVIEQIRHDYGGQTVPAQDVLGLVRKNRKTHLVQLRNTNLEVAITRARGELATVDKQIFAKRADWIKARSTAERNRLAGELRPLLQQRKSLEKQVELHLEKEQDLRVVSPMRGQIATWDVKQRRLTKLRPVQRGQALLRVANLEGPWQLELDMPEHRMGHIARFRNGLPEGEKQKVIFILATDPGIEHTGTVKEVYLGAEVRGEEGNTVPIKVEIDKAEVLAALQAHAKKGELSELRSRAEVNAKVYCGRRSIGYVWFHDLQEFIQSRILFRFF